MKFAELDMDRTARTGIPEAVFCQGKTSEAVGIIMKRFFEDDGFALGTRASEEDYQATKRGVPQVEYNQQAGVIYAVKNEAVLSREGRLAVISAGTADIPVAEEAAVVAELLGLKVSRFFDVGVAGIHRLLGHMEEIEKADLVITVAGMDGALPSVVGGLVPMPVIAVPTSVGYGANFSGIAPLLTMLNSCAPGVTVVNIDNGFGAACAAVKILRRK